MKDKKFGDGEAIPEGWWKGCTNCGKGTKGYIFINNGKEQTQIPKSQNVPNGWTKGALPFMTEHKEKISQALKQHQRTDEHSKNISINHKGEEYQQKMKAINLQKYGVEHTFQAEEIKRKIKETNLQKYGVEYPTQCEEIKERVKQTIQKHFGVDYPMQAKEVQEKSKQTCLEKYGVMYNIFLSNQYSNNSQANQAFAKLLEDNNIEYTREFPLQNYCYDFKVGNILIEINPFATYNSLWGIYGNDPTPIDYHFNKTTVAKQNGYHLIHIFDWDNKGKIIKLLKQRPVVYARQCLLKEITNKQCNDFF